MQSSTKLIRDGYVESQEDFEVKYQLIRTNKDHTEEIEDRLEEAKKQAKEILAGGIQKAEQIKTEAYQKGYTEGLDRSTAEGQEIIKKAREHSEALLVEIEKYRENTLEQLTGEIKDLVVEITEKILKAELNQGSDLTMNLVQTAINEVKSRQKVHIFVNPRDLAKVEQEKVVLNAKLDKATVELLVDPLIELGGCRILTEKGWVDATIDNQLKELKELLVTETA